MNPFIDLIESTRLEDGHDRTVPDRLNLRTVGYEVDDISEISSTPSTNYKPRRNRTDPSENKTLSKEDMEDEVYALLFRLRQLVGDIDTKPILEKLEQKRLANLPSAENKVAPNTSFKMLDTKSNGKNKTARFALTSPVVMNRHEQSKMWASVDSGDIEAEAEAESGVTTSRTNRSSRYSLGSNRFSTRARQLSIGTLNYVGGNKLLRTNTKQSVLSPDPYACMSPNKLVRGNTLGLGSVSMDTPPSNFSAKSHGPEIELDRGPANFVEFCVVGVESALLSGEKPLEVSSLQPTEVISMFPIDPCTDAVVGNIHEYCFPFGAELRSVTRRELDQLSVTANTTHAVGGGKNSGKTSHQPLFGQPAPSSVGSIPGLHYQIMQFTDSTGVVFYAVCVVSTEPVEIVSPELQCNLEELQNSVAAANIIKRYLAYFVHRKKQFLNEQLNAKWQENIAKTRTKSMASVTSYLTSTETKSGKSSSNRSIFKAFKRVIGASFKPNKSESSGSVSWLGNGKKANSYDKGSDANGSISNESPTISVNPKRMGMGHKDSILHNSPGSYDSPMLVRQRSHSLTSPGSEADRVRSIDELDGVASLSNTGISLALSSAEVGVDGSPYQSRSLANKLDQSNKKVAVLTQRAYCIISDKPLHAIFFQILEAIAVKERERALMRWGCLSRSRNSSYAGTTSAASTPRNRSGCSTPTHCDPAAPIRPAGMRRDISIGNPASLGAHVSRRNAFLSHVQYFAFPQEVRALEHKRPLSVATGRQLRRFVDIPGHEYMNSFRISTRVLSLSEWTIALAVALIPSELVVRIHSLLLQELSLLVYGSDPGMVTAIATAFNLLLQPFAWEGIFVPLLPTAAYEALDAPVPFIVGVVASSRPVVQIAPSAGILCIDDFLYHPDLYVPSCFDEATLRHTLATRDGRSRNFATQSAAATDADGEGEVDGAGLDHSLTFFESPCPEESQQGVNPLLDPMQCSQLKELQLFIAYHAVKIKASLRVLHSQRRVIFGATCVLKAVLHDLSDEALRSLSHILGRMHSYNSSLCGEVLTQPGGWKQFGVLNSRSNQFEFLPDLFLAPQRANLRLQECVINTQLFVSFMNEQSEAYLKLQPQRVFISDWIYFRLLRQKKSKRRSARIALYS